MRAKPTSDVVSPEVAIRFLGADRQSAVVGISLNRLQTESIRLKGTTRGVRNVSMLQDAAGHRHRFELDATGDLETAIQRSVLIEFDALPLAKKAFVIICVGVELHQYAVFGIRSASRFT